MKNTTAPHSFGKTPIGQFERMGSRTQKAAIRRMVKKGNRLPDLSKLHQLPLYQRLEQAILSDEFKQTLQNHGLTSVLEVASLKNYTALKQHIEQKAAQTRTTLPQPSYRFYEAAKREALKVYNLIRHTITVKDPINQGLRHTTSNVSPTLESLLREGEANITYANPDSIQSDQSLAAYLKYIYDLAKNSISQDGAYALDTRRPDLKDIELSEDNLKKEITTLELVNEVLLGQLNTKFENNQEENVFNALKTRFYPLALPFDLEKAQVSTALAQMGEQTLNELARRTFTDDYAIANGNFSLVPNVADALNLLKKPNSADIWGNEVKLLSSPNTNKSEIDGNIHLTTTGDVFETEAQQKDLYGGMSQTEIVKVSNFLRLTEISFDELCQLYRQYGVRDDLSQSPKCSEYGGFFFSEANFNLQLKSIDNGNDWQLNWNGNDYLGKQHLRSMNFLIRLYKRTGLPFHQLDWLLQIPGASSKQDTTATHTIPIRNLKDFGFDVLAHYFYYHQQFDISVDEYVALLWHVNPYYRLDQEEISLLRQLFGDDAPMVREKTQSDTIILSDVDNNENKPLGDVLRQGLKLSRTQWNTVIAKINPNSDIKLNEDTLGRLYRISQFFRLLGWDVLSGLTLAEKCGNNILNDLIAIPSADNTKKILFAMNRLVSLAQWMKTAKFTPEALIKILTSSEKVTAQLQATETIKSWLQGLEQTVATHRLQASDFQPFTKWKITTPGGTTTKEISAETWFNELQSKNILDAEGFVKNVITDTIKTAVEGILTANNVPTEGNKDIVVDFLLQTKDSQQQDLLTQIAQLGDNVNPEVIAPMLLWMNTNPYTVLSTLLAENSQELDKLKLIYNLQRYLLAIATLSLGMIEVALVAETPALVCPKDSDILKQLFYLQKFKSWQNTQATADAWFTYLILANSEQTPGNELKGQLKAILALLLDCPDTDINTLLGETVATTIKDLDYLVRRIDLSQDLCLSADELNLVLAMNTDNPDVKAAAGAILGGLSRYDDGSQKQAYRNSLGEQLRDALVALFRSDVVAPDETLKAKIKDTESLYEYLLLDVNVSSAVPTSRLVEACSSIQLYINRVLEGLESASFTGANQSALKQEWEIAQNYRIWEANQKLERYPANYIEPELRYKKSPIFENFEAALGSGELNEEAVQTAIYGYMEELQRIAELTVCGFFLETVPEETMTFHFVARSNWEQEQYFYRSVVIYLDDERLKDSEKYEKAFEWEPWQEIQISPTNPVIYEMSVCKAWNRLFFFWLELEETQTKEGNKRYYVRPKYLRTKMNGLMGNVLSPKIEVAKTIGEGFEPLEFDRKNMSIKTFNPIFVDQEIKLSYTIKIDDETYFYTVTVSDKVAIFSDADPFILYDPTQEGFDFRTILSDDPCLRLGYEIVSNPQKKSIHPPSGFANACFLSGSGDRKLTMRDMNFTVDYSYSNSSNRMVFKEFGMGHLYDSATRSSSCIVDLSGCELFYQIRILDSEGKDIYQEISGNVLPSTLRKTPEDQIFFPSCRLDVNSPDILYSINEHLDLESNPNAEFTIEVKWIANYGNIKETDIINPSTIKEWTLDGTSQAHQEWTGSFSVILSQKQSEKSAPTALAFSEDKELGTESYLYFSPYITPSPANSYVSLLYSEAMGQLARSFPMPEGQSLLSYLFTTNNQRLSEGKVNDFYTKLYEILGTPNANKCKPESTFNFDGSFGIYGWEIFYHIPSLVASKYIEQGDYDAAKKWFNAIYDPSTISTWNVSPLRDGIDQSGMDHNNGITDPDEIALDNPVYYQQATIRQYLEMMIAAGDDAYRQETQEALQQAKMFYVSGKNLFSAELSKELETLTATDWHNPTLKEVTKAHFHPPYNAEIRNLYQTFEERLDNLRHWLSIDGKPLNIPLLAPPINPRQLQVAAQQSLAKTATQSAASLPCPYSFDEILAKAQGYVRDLQGMSVRLQSLLEQRDDRKLAWVIQNETVGGYGSQFAVQELNIKMAKKAKQIADAQLTQVLIQLEGETQLSSLLYSGVFALAKSALLVKKGLLKTKRISFEASTLGSALVPKIAGFSFGGMSPETGFIGNLIGTVIQKLMLADEEADLEKRQEKFNKAVERGFKIAEYTAALTEASMAVQAAELAVEVEEATLEDMKGALGSDQIILQTMSNCLTNEEFYNWQIGQMSSLYKASYDVTLSFCRLVEQVFQSETGAQPTPVRSHWSGKDQGLSAPYGLALDLERMDLAYTQYLLNKSDGENTLSVSLSQLNTIDGQTSVIDSLLTRGEAVFETTEEMFDQFYPDQYDRRIENIRVIFPDLHSQGQLPYSRLTQLSNTRYPNRDRSNKQAKTLKNVLAYQSLSLNHAETDTRTLTQQNRRLRTFQGTGVHATWHLSVPAIVKAIQDKRAEIALHAMLKEYLKDIILEVSYTAKW